MTLPIVLQPDRAAVKVSNTSVYVMLKKLTETAVIPSYATEGAAGMDLVADEDSAILGNCRKLVKTNIAIALPAGFEAQVRPRSGLALKNGITVLNSPGTIDPDYRGGIGVVLHNTSSIPFVINKGDRIAQLVIAPFSRAHFTEVDSLDATERGAGGFGSTDTSRLPADVCKKKRTDGPTPCEFPTCDCGASYDRTGVAA